MRKLKKYIAVSLAGIILMPIMFSKNVMAESVQIENIQSEGMFRMTNGLAETKETDEKIEIETKINIQADSDKTTDGTQIVEKIQEQENEESTEKGVSESEEGLENERESERAESIDDKAAQESEESKDTRKSNEQTDSTIENQATTITEKEAAIKKTLAEEQEKQKQNETIIVGFEEYDLYRQEPFGEIAISDRNALSLPTKISILNVNNEIVEIDAVWICENDILTTDYISYCYQLTLPQDYILMDELKEKYENGELTLPFITVTIQPDQQSDQISSLLSKQQLVLEAQTAYGQSLVLEILDRLNAAPSKYKDIDTSHYTCDNGQGVSDNGWYRYGVCVKATVSNYNESTGVLRTWYTGSDEYNGCDKNCPDHFIKSLKSWVFPFTPNKENMSYGLEVDGIYKNVTVKLSTNGRLTWPKSKKISIPIDRQKPTYTTSVTNHYDTQNGPWTNVKSLTFTVNAYDQQSGISRVVWQKTNDGTNWETLKADSVASGDTQNSYTSQFTTTEEGYGCYRAVIYDKCAFNATAYFTKRMDYTAPISTATINGILINGWYRDDTSLTISSMDNLTGIGELYRNNVNIENGEVINVAEGRNNIYYYYSVDGTGNIESTKAISLSVDASAPINVSVTAPTEWTKNNVQLTVKGQDTYSGLESLKVQYSLNNSLWTDYRMVKYMGSTALETVTSIYATNNGYYRVMATDRVGHTTISSVFKVTNIDVYDPKLSHAVTGNFLNGWYKESANLNLTASDTGGSGVKSITVNNNATVGDKRSIKVTNEGSNQFICYATDNAGGMTRPVKDITIKVDDSSPINLSLTPNTIDWTKVPIQMMVKADDVQSGVNTIELQYTKDKTDINSWMTYKTESFNGVNQASREISVTDNGYYRIVVNDQVGFQAVSKVLKVNNYDAFKPDGSTIGIEPDTIQWVDEATGVEVTSYGSDNESGLSEINVWAKDEKGYFEPIKKGKFSGEITIEETTYDVHKNNCFKTEVIDKAGNYIRMLDEEALEVDNIDPEAPNLIIESISSQDNYISTGEGYVIRTVIEDSQSGFSEAELQKLNKHEEWEDYQTQYKILKNGEEPDTCKEEAETSDEENIKEETLTKVARKRVLVAAENQTSADLNNQMPSEEEVREQGESKVIIEYTVRENGIYRVRGADLVNNKAYSNDTVVVNNLDGSMPVITVEGNPTIWQNTDAAIQVTAVDAETKIVKMTLDKIEKDFKENEDGEFYFTFEATKNQEFTVTAVDEAGNSTTEIIKVIKIDKDAPVLNTDISKSWWSMIFKDYRNLRVNGFDELSKIAKVSVTYQGKESILSNFEYEKAKFNYKGNYKIFENGDYIVTITDQAGNITTQSISEANLDFSAPWLKVEGNPIIWQNTDAAITVTAIDEDSKIEKMTLNKKEQTFTIDENGEYHFTFTATKNQKFIVAAYDKSGNVTAQVVQVTKIDKEIPTINTVLDTKWKQDGYRIMSYNGTDELSGIAEIMLEHEGVIEILTRFSYEKEQKHTSNEYRITQDGNYIVTIKDHAGNSNKRTVSEAEAKILKAIEVVVPPDKTAYHKAENFKKKGMIVDAIYNDHSRSLDIKEYVILNEKNLSLDQTKIDLSYMENGVIAYTDTPIQVGIQPTQPDTPEPEEPLQPDTPEPEEPLQPDTPHTSNNPIQKSENVAMEEMFMMEQSENKMNQLSKEMEEKIVENVLQNSKERTRFPFKNVLAVAGIFIILLLIRFSNVKVYSQAIDGSWNLLGKTKARKVKGYYLVKLSKLLRIKAESDRYKLVFSKGFKRRHKECELVIRIERADYERYLPKDSDTVCVEHWY
ncbi:hypothetical protein C8E03_104107 [Lachnotalea glycerini]|uniref:Ig-like domain-containing protein n=1 Tax=Lachnotalea glycerini TaxID=1763509 RepID=A0A318ERX1_9FIRM|nr:hypothetical protein [Lachnotalea glycerini]PXV91099.1 hypothetical protein C8E03_104107 [Lachnotalea glycerini]